MAFLFKSKKNQDRALGGRDPNGSQGSVHSPDARARVKTDEKASIQRSTPTGSLNSLDNEGRNASPDQQAFGPPRRAQTGDPPATQPAVTDVQQVSIEIWIGLGAAFCTAVDDATSRLLTCIIHHLASQWRPRCCSSRCRQLDFLLVPVVSAETVIHNIASESVSSLWRRRECRLIQRRRCVRDGRPDQQLDGQG